MECLFLLTNEMDDETIANQCAQITNNIISILSLDHKKVPVVWDYDMGIMKIDSQEVTDDSEYLIAHRCVSCGEDRIMSTRAFLFKLKRADIHCSRCTFYPQ